MSQESGVVLNVQEDIPRFPRRPRVGRWRTCHRDCVPAGRFAHRAIRHDRGSAGGSVSPYQRFAQVGKMVPWAKLDPNTIYTYDGPTEGKGASVQWSGNSNVGKGKMTILESQPNELIRIKLEFTEPMEDTSTTEFTFKSEGTQTVINWRMFGKHTIMSKGMCLFMDMDKMIGNDFEKGLASMKANAEK
jgi:uncharacterized protein YndB with AHSA1/START domain